MTTAVALSVRRPRGPTPRCAPPRSRPRACRRAESSAASSRKLWTPSEQINHRSPLTSVSSVSDRVSVRAHPDTVGQHVAHGMRVAPDVGAGAQQHAQPRVVARHLLQLAVTQPVGPAVADVRDDHAIALDRARPRSSCPCRRSARPDAGLIDPGVGDPERDHQPVRQHRALGVETKGPGQVVAVVRRLDELRRRRRPPSSRRFRRRCGPPCHRRR